MVWKQYVFEANEGYDVYDSDEEEYNENNKLTIEDWEVEHSDVLWRMWHTINTLLYDAQIEHTGKFCDFVAFCHMHHDPLEERVTFEYQEQTKWYEERINDVWKTLRRMVNDNHLHEEFFRGARFNDFFHFTKNFMCIY